MDKQILNKLSINFEKTWNILSQEEKKDCVLYMKNTLKKGEEFYKESLTQLYEIKPELDKLVTNDMQEIISLTKRIFKFTSDWKFAKEDRLQEKILKSDNPQLLFSDIVSTDESFYKADSIVFDIVTQAKQAINKNSYAGEKSNLTSLVLKTDLTIETFEKYINVFEKQSKKVEALFPSFSRKNDNNKEITL